MLLSGQSPDGRLVEIVELRDHPWFVASQFHPEFKCRPDRPHPLFHGFVATAVALRDGVEPRLTAVGPGPEADAQAAPPATSGSTASPRPPRPPDADAPDRPRRSRWTTSSRRRAPALQAKIGAYRREHRAARDRRRHRDPRRPALVACHGLRRHRERATRRRADAAPGRVDHQDDHGDRRHAAPRRGPLPPGRPRRPVPAGAGAHREPARAARRPDDPAAADAHLGPPGRGPVAGPDRFWLYRPEELAGDPGPRAPCAPRRRPATSTATSPSSCSGCSSSGWPGRLDAYVRERILDPLGMADTTAHPDAGPGRRARRPATARAPRRHAASVPGRWTRGCSWRTAACGRTVADLGAWLGQQLRADPDLTAARARCSPARRSRRCTGPRGSTKPDWTEAQGLCWYGDRARAR